MKGWSYSLFSSLWFREKISIIENYKSEAEIKLKKKSQICGNKQHTLKQPTVPRKKKSQEKLENTWAEIKTKTQPTKT